MEEIRDGYKLQSYSCAVKENCMIFIDGYFKLTVYFRDYCLKQKF